MEDINRLVAALRNYSNGVIHHYKPIGTGKPGTISRVTSYLKDFTNKLQAFTNDVNGKANVLMKEAASSAEIDIQRLKEAMLSECKSQYREFIKLYKPGR